MIEGEVLQFFPRVSLVLANAKLDKVVIRFDVEYGWKCSLRQVMSLGLRALNHGVPGRST